MNDARLPTGHDPFQVPRDKALGCLPRVSKPGDWFPLAAEKIETIPRSDWPDLIPKVRNSSLVWTVLDQDGVGSCASEAATGAVMAMRELSGQSKVLLNPWFVYHTVSGGSDRGSSIDENLRFVRENGIASMDVWPRSKGWRTRPSAEAVEDAKKYRIEEAYDVTNVDEFVSCILKGFVVEFGYRPGGGGHAVCAVDVVDMDRFRFINSWHESWGDNGFGTLRFSDIDWRFGAWALRVPTFSGQI